MVSILPNEICALISSFLDEEGDVFREQAGTFIFKDVRNGKTYGNGLLHSFNDQPAIIWNDGTQAWYQHGKLHRDGDQPAEIWPNGTRYWYQHGKIHRGGDKPAIIRNNGIGNGIEEWYQHGEREWRSI